MDEQLARERLEKARALVREAYQLIQHDGGIYVGIAIQMLAATTSALTAAIDATRTREPAEKRESGWTAFGTRTGD